MNGKTKSCHELEKHKDKWWKDRFKFKSKTQNKGIKTRTQKLKPKHKMCKTKV